jgi:hypothetical protein
MDVLARFASSLIAASCVACTAPVDSSTGAAHAELVYGDDDRYEVSDPGVDDGLYEAARAVAAVIPRSRVRSAADGTTHIVALSLGEAEQLCEGEPFAAQPSVAECTAVLIDDNLLATAGHCFAHAFDCQNYLFVFDYFYEAGDQQLGPMTTYECVQTRARADDAHDRSPRNDFAIVELTQRVAGRTPLLLRESPIEADQPLIVISATGGVPLKVDLGARVLDPRPEHDDYFVLESDTFYGSSGAPVLDHDGALLGLFARGQRDYEYDDGAGCYRTVRMASPPPTDDAEHASFAHAAVDALCATGYPSDRLCGIAAACGDDICSPNEDHASCARDCAVQAAPMRIVQPRLDLANADPANGCSALPRPIARPPWAWLCAMLLALQRRRTRWLWTWDRRPSYRHVIERVLNSSRCSRAHRASTASSGSSSTSPPASCVVAIEP